MNALRRKNGLVVAALFVMIGSMAGLTAYSPTLYRLFCSVTGYGGTTQRAFESRRGFRSRRPG
jgi:cytochrome c oxidase assembly protein subunit 11